MKRVIISVVIGVSIGYCTANYRTDVQRVYELGVQDGYAHQRSSTLFVANTAYQRGWEDCYQLFLKKKNKNLKVASK